MDTAAVNDSAHSSVCPPNQSNCKSFIEAYSEFRGNAQVTETGPDGQSTTTTFFQGDARKGLAGSVTVKDPAGKKVTETLSSSTYVTLPMYTDPNYNYMGYGHFWVYPTFTENHVYQNDGVNYSATGVAYTYESTYGNLTSQADQSLNGSTWTTYRSTTTDYVPNTTAYLVGFPARQQMKDGAGTVIAETQNIYDTNTDYSQAPTVGKLTAVRTWVDGAVGTGRYSQISYGYDSWGNRTTATTYSGYGTASPATTTTVYDSVVHVYPISQTTPPTANVPSGLTTNLTYDYALGVPLTESDANDPDPNSTTETGNTTISAQYDAFGRMIKLIRPGDDSANPTISISYADAFPFTTAISQKIDTTRYYSVQRVYDGMGRQTQITSGPSSGSGQTIVDTVYQSPTVTKQSVPYQGSSPNLFTVTTVNRSARTTTVTAPDGTYSTTTINGLTSTVSQYNANGTLFNNHTTTTTSDVWGRVVSVVPPTGPSVSYTLYDELDHLKTVTRAGATTTLNYDNAGRKTSMSDSDMGSWSYAYDALGNLTRQTDARGQRVCLYYDSLNRLIGKHYRNDDNCPANPTFNVSYGYDSGTDGKGHRTSMNDGSGSASWTYDTRGRMISESKTITGGGTFNSSWTYNSADQQTSMTYPVDGEVVNYNYNSRMLLDSVIGTNTYIASTTYDAAGQIDVRSFGNNTQTNYDYYPWNTQGGRLQYLKSGTTGNPTSLQNFTYSYDTVGNISSILDSLAGPQTQTFTYDALDRLTSGVATGGSNGLYSEAYAYNANTGNLTAKDPTASAPQPPNPGTTGLVSWWSMNETSGTRSDQHSTNHLTDNNTVTSTTGKQGNAAHFALVSSEYLNIPDNPSLSMGTGARMTACTWAKLDSKNSSLVQEFMAKGTSGDWEYMLRYDGRIDKFVFVVSSNGLANTLTEARANTFGSPSTGQWYFVCGGYDGANIWISVNAGARDVAAFTGDVFDGTTELRIGSNTGFGSYLDGSLDEAVLYKRSLSTNEVGWLYNNGTGRTYSELTPLSGNTITYNYANPAHAHAVSSLSNGNTYQYDADGNMTQRVIGGQTFNLSYDAENRLISVSGAATASFTYDGDGRQVISVSGGYTVYYANDFYQKASTGVVAKYYFGGTQRVAVRVSGTLYYLMADHLGSSSLGLDASGNKFSEVRYKPWGETRYSTGTIPTNYKYTGQREEPSIGLYFYNARWYDGALGRFIQADTVIPAGVQGGDRYAYVSNDPLRYTDPSGHRMCEDYGGSCVSENQMTQIIRIHQRLSRHYTANRQKDDAITIPASTQPLGSATPIVMATYTPIPTPTSVTTNLLVTPSASQCTSSPCIGNFVPPTPYIPTPFGNDLVQDPNAQDVANRSLPWPIPSDYGPDLHAAWDNLLNGLPQVLGLPATNLNQLFNGAATYTVTTVANTAINVSNGIGNVVNNAAWAANNAMNFGLSPSLPIFYIPTNSPLSPTPVYN